MILLGYIRLIVEMGGLGWLRFLQQSSESFRSFIILFDFYPSILDFSSFLIAIVHICNFKSHDPGPPHTPYP